MHMRTKKWARPLLAASDCYVDDPAAARGHWKEAFSRSQPLQIELGCGKGVSTALMAHANPGVNYVAVDISPDVLGCARRNLAAQYGGEPVDNILLTRLDIEHIDHFFAPEDEAERIIISFCNPWSQRPKHHKRRLTHPRQLMQYRAFLADGGEIWFKTDDAPLFRDSLTYFRVSGFETVYVTDDLHADGFQPNYVSEHEAKYTAAGVPIHFGIFRKLPGPVNIDPVRWRIWDNGSADAEKTEEENGMGMERLEPFAAALTARGFGVRMFATAREGAEWIASQIGPEETVGAGGSVTVRDSGLADLLRDRGNTVCWHWYEPGPETLHRANSADVYIASSNAVTRDGALVNIDGTGNRVAAMAYGPSRVYLLVGANKLVDGGIPRAIARIKAEACPPNARRLGRHTPCAETGRCDAARCPAAESMCNVTSVIDHPGTGGRQVTVVLVDENIGY